jgi:excisionase family DNA binding protein
MENLMLTTIEKDELSLMIENCVRKVVRESIGQKSSPEPEYLIGIKEAAREILGLSESRVYTLCSTKKIPHIKRGNRLYFSRQELLEWLKAGKVDTIDDVSKEASVYVAKSFKRYAKK